MLRAAPWMVRARGACVASVAAVMGLASSCGSFSATPMPGGADAGAPDGDEPDGALVEGAGPVTPRSCNEIKLATPTASSGLYTITPKSGIGTSVHCEMELFGGGLTLVGRAGAGQGVRFGWMVNTGEPGGRGAYSLDARELEFTSVVFADQTAKGPPANAVLLPVPADFVEYYAKQGLDLSRSTVETKGCTKADYADQTQMLHFIGHTQRDDQYYARDNNSDPENFGLFRAGFQLSAKTCKRSMNLDGSPGAIYVR